MAKRLSIWWGLAPLALLAALIITPVAGHAAVVAPARGTTIRATEAVNIRTGPDTSYDVEATAAAGDTASVLGGPSGDFIEVYYRNHRGWTHRSYWNAVPGLWVNRYQLTADQEAAVRWIASVTIARVPGTLSEKLSTVSEVTWWSLKEVVLSQPLTKVHRYSNCQDSNYEPLYWCPSLNWQVGIAGVHMSNTPGRVAEIEALAGSLYGSTVAAVLDHTANYAGYPDGSTGYNAILNSTGSFRTSWLLRNHGVGFTFNQAFVRPCLGSAPPDWCFGGWNEAVRYAPNAAAIIRSVQDLRAILYAIRPI
ncbi:MAG TPA: SH3 domain-containing protein [Candidatus Limnocylindrales bacterium]|nr:SH3 domain-containing protein [Candidatus Limnocylindrales bacterium]